MWIRNVLLALVFTFGLACGSDSIERIVNVDVQVGPGRQMAATLYQASGQGPGVMLMHTMGVGQRWDLQGLARHLAAQGVHVLAVDLPGHGETAPPPDMSSQQFLQETEAAFRFLASRSFVDDSRLGILGASGSVSVAIHTARQTGIIRALVGLSGHVSDQDRDFMAAPDGPVVLTVGSEQDPIRLKRDERWIETTAAQSMRELAELSPHQESRSITYQDAGHATEMFKSHPELELEIAAWLVSILQER